MAINAVGAASAVPLLWPPALSEISLGEHEIHVWCASLSDVRSISRFDGMLSADERARAGQFLFASDRRRFIARRGILRALLARYLRQDPATIRFSYGRFGKPDLARLDAADPLYFSASHSGVIAVYAMTWTSPIGIDVERLREIPGFDAVALRYCAPVEASRLTALPPERRQEELFASWTGYEALLKATGDGLGVEGAPPSGWQLRRLKPTPGYLGAIAYKDHAARLSLWSLVNPS